MSAPHGVGTLAPVGVQAQLQRTLDLLELSMQHLPEAPAEPSAGGSGQQRGGVGPNGTQAMPYNNLPASYPTQVPLRACMHVCARVHVAPDTGFWVVCIAAVYR